MGALPDRGNLVARDALLTDPRTRNRGAQAKVTTPEWSVYGYAYAGGARARRARGLKDSGSSQGSIRVLDGIALIHDAGGKVRHR